jgi:hypothetical protein
MIAAASPPSRLSVFSSLGGASDQVRGLVIENPYVGGPIPPRATKNSEIQQNATFGWRFCFGNTKFEKKCQPLQVGIFVFRSGNPLDDVSAIWPSPPASM